MNLLPKINVYLFINSFFTILAIFFCIFIILINIDNFFILFASLYLLIITIIDAIVSKIPNKITFPFLISGIFINIFFYGWHGFFSSLLGMTTGVTLMILPFLLGGMGAGDVKALGTLGAFLGPNDILQIFLYMGIAGGIIGLSYFMASGKLYLFFLYLLKKIKQILYLKDFQSLKAGKTESGIRFPYAIAIVYGTSLFYVFGEII